MTMQTTSAGTECARPLSAKPAATVRYPAAMTRRAANRRVMEVSGSSHSTTSTPFSEMMAP